jgi:ubiquinone/menaquinone biosynthesis C-methylase UbiE
VDSRPFGGTCALRGCDPKKVLVGAARKQPEDCQESIEWCQAAAEALPFAPNRFDMILAVTAICFVKDPQRTIQEAARVLRPGGSLVIGELGQYSLWALSRNLRRSVRVIHKELCRSRRALI